MKRYLLSLALILALLSVSGAALAQGGPENLLTLTDRGIQMPYPGGWTRQEVNPEFTVLLADEADMAALSGDAALGAPVIAVIATDNPERFFGPGVQGETLEDTAENWIHLVTDEAFHSEAATLGGLEAFRVSGVDSDLSAQMVGELALLPDGALLLIAALIPLGQQDFTATFDDLLARVTIEGVEAAEPAGAADLTERLDWPEMQFSIAHPASWAVHHPQDETYTLLSNPADEPNQTPSAPAVGLMAVSQAMGMPQGASAQDVMNLLASSLGGMQSAPVDITLAGQVAVRARFVQGGMHYDVVVVLVDVRALAVIGVAPEDQWEGFAPTYEAMLASVQIGGVGGGAEPAGQAGGLSDSLEAVTSPTAAPAFAPVERVAWQVASAAPVQPGNLPPQHIFPSPDGLRVAYGREDALCMWDLVTEAEMCLPLPETFPRNLRPRVPFWPMVWSPDGRRLAVVGVPFYDFRDTDLWIVDFVAGTLTNLTDDGFVGNLLEVSPAVTLEVQPAWSPDGTRIAVERTVVDEMGRLALTTLAVIDVASGAITDLARLPGHENYERDLGSIVDLAWSPDGGWLVMSIAHQRIDSDSDGLWVVEAASGAMGRLVSLQDATRALQMVFPAQEARFINGLSMTPSEGRLAFWIANPAYDLALWLFWMDSAEQIVPLALPQHPNDTLAVRMIQPNQAVWTPDGQLLVTTRVRQAVPGETLNPLVPEAVSGEVIALRLIDPETGDGILLGHLPDLPVNYGAACWGPGNDVIIGGYRLHMAAQ